MEKERKDKGIKKKRKEDISNKKKRNEEGKKTTTNSRILYPSKRCIFFLHHSGSNPGPSLHSHRSNPLRYRRLLLLSIRSGYIRKLVDGFLSRLFLVSRIVNERKKIYRSGT